MKGLLCLMGIFLTVENSWSWGPIGHRVVGEIAQRHISRRVQRKLNFLIGTENLSDLANQPDFKRSDANFRFADTWHYVSIPDNATYEDSPKNPAGDVIKAINEQTAELKNLKATKEQRKQALSFIVHFIGDIHQPLHTGRAEDRGGNSIALKWFGQDTNLHEIWDEKLVDMEKLSYTEYASFLMRSFNTHYKDGSNINILAWVKETMDMRPLVYSYPEGTVKYWEYDYRFKVREKMNIQIYRAGIRLATWLEKNL